MCLSQCGARISNTTNLVCSPGFDNANQNIFYNDNWFFLKRENKDA